MSDLTREMSDLAGRWPLLVSEVVVPAGGVGVQVVQRNPLRWGLWIAYLGQVVGQVQVSPGIMQSAADGFQLPATVPLEFHYRSNPGLTIAQWEAGNGGGAAITLLVVETLAQQ